MLTRSFRDGAFGALGGAAWRSARDLAETIRDLPDAAWTEWLARREPARAAALAALARTRRLVVVVDGLDEVGLAALAQIEAALRRAPGLWIATRRPGDDHDAADVTRLELVPFDSGDRRHLLESLGRPDLARDASRPRSHPRLLVDTPLLLSIEARIVKPGEDPDALPQDQLFARFFEMLLRQAQRDRRLSPEGSQLLRLLVGSVVGTLALLWLRDGARPLDATRVEVVLEQQDLPPVQRIAALDALEFGYLLRPIEGGWEFAHRTLAEWAAAAAVHRDVERRLQHDPDAPAERSVLAPFLAEPGPRHRGRWQQLLRFYAPHVLDPVGLLTALVGPDAAPHWGSARDADDARASVPSEYEVHGDYDKELAGPVSVHCLDIAGAEEPLQQGLRAVGVAVVEAGQHVAGDRPSTNSSRATTRSPSRRAGGGAAAKDDAEHDLAAIEGVLAEARAACGRTTRGAAWRGGAATRGRSAAGPARAAPRRGGSPPPTPRPRGWGRRTRRHGASAQAGRPRAGWPS